MPSSRRSPHATSPQGVTVPQNGYAVAPPDNMLAGTAHPSGRARCAEPSACPDGHTGAAITTGRASGTDRHTFRCTHPDCEDARFHPASPGPPHRAGEDRQARWIRNSAPADMRARRTDPPPVTLVATQLTACMPRPNTHPATTAAPEHPTHGPCLGDDTYGCGDVRGKALGSGHELGEHNAWRRVYPDAPVHAYVGAEPPSRWQPRGSFR